MLDSDVNRLPVVDADGKLVGIVTRADLVRAFVRDDKRDRSGRFVTTSSCARCGNRPNAFGVGVRSGEVTLSGQVKQCARRGHTRPLRRAGSRCREHPVEAHVVGSVFDGAGACSRRGAGAVRGGPLPRVWRAACSGAVRRRLSGGDRHRGVRRGDRRGGSRLGAAATSSPRTSSVGRAPACAPSRPSARGRACSTEDGGAPSRSADCSATPPTGHSLTGAVARARRQRHGGKVAVIGAGPAGLVCAGELAAVGHAVTVFDERANRADSCATRSRRTASFASRCQNELRRLA